MLGFGSFALGLGLLRCFGCALIVVEFSYASRLLDASL